MHGADVSTLPSDPQLFNTFVRFFGLIFLKSVAKIAAVCNDLSKTELSLQSRALFGRDAKSFSPVNSRLPKVVLSSTAPTLEQVT